LIPILAAVALAAATPITAHTAATHPMRYSIAMPNGWAAGKTWPVVVVIADAHRDFVANLTRFAAVHTSTPFILVAPEVLTCGGTRGQTSPPYSYSTEEWRLARNVGEFEFDDAGLAAVLEDVHSKWGGETRAYLTGWEAGGHTVWAETLRRPERWHAVAPVTPNYQGRGLSAETFSEARERAALPIQVLWCGAPTGDAAKFSANLRSQADRALADAREHGFTPAPVRVVPGADHGPLETAVMAWFDSLAQLQATPTSSR
jgi:dienelactone hydrolase